ncbi:hypothetical protein [Kitasatospora phosalacinea]|uniref:Uncharacterized protein n=1 Tax=Kitasatospora phosalacinea TaxID=2065 RepID=A0A9W6PP07_9ACTN|nr:hypothetical protein [Kitasatospora phosalacinea]GLW58562.1 hypothetical protein Kpho01_65730 [Kitasatospora phosalacinea]
MITTYTRTRLLLRYEVEHAETGLTYYTVRAPHVIGTITLHPEAAPGETANPDAYTRLRFVSGRYDPDEGPGSYTDRLAVYNAWIYDGITLPTPGTPTDRDPWGQLHRSTYELATEKARARAKEVGEKIVNEYRADRRHVQHARYLRSVADRQLSRAAREADDLRPAVDRLGVLETQIDRWTRLRDPGTSSTTTLEVGGHLADWIDARLAGRQPLTSADHEIYRSWAAARRLGERAAIFQPRRVVLHTAAALASFARILTEASLESPSKVARADARCRLHRIAEIHPVLVPEVPHRESEEAPH